jgi:hypothetical protein
MVCGNVYSIRGTWHRGGETPSGSCDPWGDFTTLLVRLPEFSLREAMACYSGGAQYSSAHISWLFVSGYGVFHTLGGVGSGVPGSSSDVCDAAAEVLAKGFSSVDHLTIAHVRP